MSTTATIIPRTAGIDGGLGVSCLAASVGSQPEMEFRSFFQAFPPPGRWVLTEGRCSQIVSLLLLECSQRFQ